MCDSQSNSKLGKVPPSWCKTGEGFNHVIFHRGVNVEKVKIKVTEPLPPPTFDKGQGVFLVMWNSIAASSRSSLKSLSL